SVEREHGAASDTNTENRNARNESASAHAVWLARARPVCPRRRGDGACAGQLDHLRRHRLEPAVVDTRADQYPECALDGPEDGDSDWNATRIIREHADRRRRYDVRHHGVRRGGHRLRSEHTARAVAVSVQTRASRILLR